LSIHGYRRLPASRLNSIDLANTIRWFGFSDFTPARRREILAWLLPVALATTSAISIATALMDELRRRRLVVPGPFIVEQMVAAVTALAERHLAHQLTRDLLPAPLAALDTLLAINEGTSMRELAWARQPPGAPGHRAIARLVEHITALRAVILDPACAEGVHAERLRKLAREGARFTAQHLRALSPLRRHATLVATVIDTITRLTDDSVALFDRAVEHMFRRAEVREQNAPAGRRPRHHPDLASDRLAEQLGGCVAYTVLEQGRGHSVRNCRQDHDESIAIDPALNAFRIVDWTSSSRDITNKYNLTFKLKADGAAISPNQAKAAWHQILENALDAEDLKKLHPDD
jgi:hypothetical protein